MDNQKKIIIYLPYLFSIRDFIFSNSYKYMQENADCYFYLLTNVSENYLKELKNNFECKNISILKLTSNVNASRNRIFSYLATKLMKFNAEYIYKALMLRFAAVHKLSSYKIKKNKSSKERNLHKVFYEYKLGEKAGFPFPESKLLLTFFYKLFHSFLQLLNSNIKNRINSINPDLFVFGRLQLHDTAPIARYLKKVKIPMISIVSSWDHPTTKGPIIKGMSRYIVASKRMKEELVNLHSLQENKIFVTGKPQMDYFKDNKLLAKNKQDFLKECNLPLDVNIVTMCPNTTGLKEHEVSIAKKIADDFRKQKYGNSILIIRSHPQDINWKRDFKSLESSPYVYCFGSYSYGNKNDEFDENSKKGINDQLFLANLMKFSDVVIQSRGSIVLDAIAFDTPVISLAFDGDLKRELRDSFALEYNYEHYKPILEDQSTFIVDSYSKLEAAIKAYLKNSNLHNKNRKKTLERQIAPFDGKACKRLIDYIVLCAIEKEKMFAEADWGITCVGNLTWYKEQTANIMDYINK